MQLLASRSSQAQRKEAIKKSAPQANIEKSPELSFEGVQLSPEGVVDVLLRVWCAGLRPMFCPLFPFARSEVPSSPPRQPGAAALQPGRHGHCIII